MLANGCYRWLAQQLRGFEKAAPKQVYRKFVETGGTMESRTERIVVRFDKRSHNPVLREGRWTDGPPMVPWLGDRFLCFSYP